MFPPIKIAKKHAHSGSNEHHQLMLKKNHGMIMNMISHPNNFSERNSPGQQLENKVLRNNKEKCELKKLAKVRYFQR